ncbi:molybdopterin molybdotransferase MoeA [Saccharibacillus sp. CPCC 101409]|uniref:molybdopterin molybdotransferase MoeA n=1 Tax=Saccharibacillus sp. CPCC 101409 TaxID=3058041 RepID=UPI002671F49D|nr:gephyrin-like molybdotransferase Glp [Saccharibacillus sp. CPCC 101409]MDO3412357.1 molybdopterin molybdotransferase MoeA [Saccharibacillus sp. CPCC 101409]
MVEIRNPIPVSEAIERVQAEARRLGSEIVPLEEAYGRILAQPLLAVHDVPSFDRSPYDGFAIRAEDSAGASGDNRVAFTVVDHIGAGAVSGKIIGPNEAVRIMTGAQLPEGADAVAMLEQTQAAGAPEQTGGVNGKTIGVSFTIRKAFTPGENVSFRGEDMRQGEEVLPAGSLVHPGTVALLATFGCNRVEVAKLPVVGVLATGTELLEAGVPLEPGKIRNSNGPMIAAQLRRMGISARMYAAAADRLDDMLDTVRRALNECDCLITTGGVSVGDFDLLPAVYERLGATVLFNKVAMRPGSVTTVAALDGRYLFGLSGNPSACYTGFELFARPALLRMMGAQRVYPLHTRAKLAEDFAKANPFARFIRAVYDGESVRPAGFNKSNAVSSIGRANALLVLPGGTRGFQTGDIVDVLLPGMEEGSAEWTL